MPWLLALDRTRTLRGAALSGLGMCVAFVAAIFAWFGFAIAVYSAGAAAMGLVVLLVCAPLLQPQFVVFAVVRHAAGRRHGRALAALTAAFAWVAAEWIFPKLLADNLAHGFYPSIVLRQFADIAGTEGITFLIVLINEGLAAAVAQALAMRGAEPDALPIAGERANGRGGRRPRARDEAPPPDEPSRTRGNAGIGSVLAPLGASLAILAVMTGYGHWRLAQLGEWAKDAKPLRVGLVQSNIAAYDRLRREMGTYEAVRYVLDTHFAMTREAVERSDLDAVMWSETVFPTTFGKPKSDTGAELDREIVSFVSGLGVPLVFGSYDSDERGEYNSAVFLEPKPAGAAPAFQVYRKSRLFFLTEYVPEWMDGPLARSWMPWAGTWLPGPGARVLRLRTKDREVPVLPMICLDDVDAGLAIEGARGGAEMILTMSNDSWFSEHAGGAHLHLVVAAFRSIETRLPQLRVTNDGITAVIDPTGGIVARAEVGERRVVVGDLAPRTPPATLMVAWGDWLGPVAAAATLLLLGAAALRPARARPPEAPAPGAARRR